LDFVFVFWGFVRDRCNQIEERQDTKKLMRKYRKMSVAEELNDFTVIELREKFRILRLNSTENKAK